MPAGTIGLRASGKVSEEDYRDVLVPTINGAMEHGNVRLLYVLEDETDYKPGAVWADTKMWFKNHKGWERLAIVSDADWLENAVKVFGRLMPGEVKVFEPDDVRDAKQWLVGLDDDDPPAAESRSMPAASGAAVWRPALSRHSWRWSAYWSARSSTCALLGPPSCSTFCTPLRGDYALTAFVLTLVATAVAHLMALVTPRPRMFFSWIVGLATVAGSQSRSPWAKTPRAKSPLPASTWRWGCVCCPCSGASWRGRWG